MLGVALFVSIPLSGQGFRNIASFQTEGVSGVIANGENRYSGYQMQKG